MGKMMNGRDELIKNIQEIEAEIEQYQPAEEQLKKKLSIKWS